MNPTRSLEAPTWAVGLAAILAVAVLWAYRTVVSMDVLAELLLPWLWLSVWTVAAWGAGGFLYRPAKRGTNATAMVARLALGSALLSLVATLLACIGGFRPGVLLAVLGAATVTGVAGLVRRRTVFLPTGHVPWPALAAIGAAALAIGVALPAPPVMYDTLNYHLAFPAQWLRAGRFLEFPRHYYSYYPAAGGAAYGYALAALGPWAAKALHLWAGLLAAGVAGALGCRLGGRSAGGWAAVLFFLTPSVLHSAGYATADLWVAAWGGAAFLLLMAPEEDAPHGRFAAVGFLGGSAAAAKILGLATVALPLAVVALILTLVRRSTPRRWIDVGIVGVFAGIPLAPWLGRNLLWTGNPLYPYFRPLFGGPPVGMSIARELAQNGQAGAGVLHRLLEVVLALPVRTVHPLQMAGNIGPLWLILLPVAVFLPGLRRRRSFLPLTVWLGCGLLVWGSLVQFGRFLLPVLVGGAALAGAALAALGHGRNVPVARRALMVLVVGALAWNVSTLLDPLNVGRLEVTAGVLRGDELLNRWVSYWPAARFVREKLPPHARILMVGESRSLYVDRDVMVEDPYRVPELAELAARARDGAELAATLRSMGITHILVNQREMPRLAELRGAPDYWSGAGAHGRTVLHDFFVNHVQKVFGAPGVWVGKLIGTGVTPQSRTAPGGTAGSPGG